VSVGSSETSAHVVDEDGGVSESEDGTDEDGGVGKSEGGNDEHVMPRDVAKRERRQFITHNAMAAGGTWGAGILGLLLQALVSHHFAPGDYGQVFAVFSFYTVLTQPAAGFSRMVAWTTSRELATKHGTDVESSALLRMTIRRLTLIGTALGLVFILASVPLAQYFGGVPLLLVIYGAIGVPFMFATSPMLASLQGEQRWVPWSALSIGIALSRIVFVIIFGLLFGVAGVMLGISVAAAVLYVIALAMVWPRMRRGRGPTGWRPLWRFLLVSVASTVTVSVLMGSDVILVQHFYPGKQAGQFSAVTVTARALFFAMGSVTSVLFPKVATRHARQRGTKSVVFTSVGIALVGGLLGLLVFSVLSTSILHAFSGAKYVDGAGYIGWYALGMPLLAAVVMLSNTQQSLADLKLLWVLIPGTLIKPVLIIFFHSSLLVVSLMSDLAIAAVLVALAVQYLLTERRQRLLPSPGGAPDDDTGGNQGLIANAPA
jgi:O-antigen/teichoic acid export membrane protein